MNYIKFWRKKINLLKWNTVPKIVYDKKKKYGFQMVKLMFMKIVF